MRFALLALLLSQATCLSAADLAWLYPPDKGGKTLPEGSDFEVGRDGAAWLLPSSRAMLRLDSGRSWKVAEPVRDLQYVEEGALVVATDRCVGTLDVANADRKKGSLPVKEAFLLPSSGFRLGSAGAGSVLAFGRNLHNGKFEAYLVGPGPLRKVLLQGGEEADAALWRAGKLILAFGTRLVEMDPSGTSQPRFFGKLPQPAQYLAWVEGAGLAASTDAGVFLARPGKAPRKIYDCGACAIRAHGSSLYLLSENPAGILRLKDLGGAR